MGKEKFFSAKRVTGLAILLALVIVLQYYGGYFKLFGTSLSFVLIPIVLAGMLYGPLEGGLIGFCFGVVVVLQGITGVDVFTEAMILGQPVWTILLCLVKGTAAGVVSGYVYKIIKKKNRYVGVFTAAASAPIVNTGLFIVGALCFLQETIRNAPSKITGYSGEAMIYYLVVIVAGTNFLIELSLNLILAPTLYRAVNIIDKKFDGDKNNSPAEK